MNLNNITFQRWSTIIIYGFLTAVFFETLLRLTFATEAIDWWINSFNSFGLFSKSAFSFIIGGLLFKFLLKMNAYPEKALFSSLSLYPPVIFSVLPAILILLYFSGDIDFLVFVNIPIVFFIIGFVFNRLKRYLSTKSEIHEQGTVFNITPESSYEEFKNWFNDDSPISNTQQLSPNLKLYAERLISRIQNTKDKSVHISLCGNFGSGKSSIIKSVINELESNFISSNIDTWGTDIKGLNAFVLTKVVEDVAQHIDMSGFKSLPSEYLEALKLGNNTTNLLAVFSNTSSDPRQGLIKLDAVLAAVNKKLLITIQDIDRCLEPKRATDELAALLDKLKGLGNISFIIALGYEKETSESIRKVCDYREDLIKIDNSALLFGFLRSLNNRAESFGYVVSHKEIKKNNIVTSNIKTYIEHKIRMHRAANHSNPYELISSERSFKHICRKINFIWHKDYLMGEIDLESLALLIILREELPLIFESLIKNGNALRNAVNYESKKDDTPKQDISPEKKANAIELNKCTMYYPRIGADKLNYHLAYLFECNNELGQSALYKHSYQHCNYINRVLLESIPSTEIRDQEVLSLFKNIDKEENIELLITNFKSSDKGLNWIEAYMRFSSSYFKPAKLDVYKTIYMKMVDYYYQETVDKKETERQINSPLIRSFLVILLNKCLTDKNLLELFEVTSKIPQLFFFKVIPPDTPDICNYIDLFLNKDIEKKLYSSFIKQLKQKKGLIEKLINVDSSLQNLFIFIAEIIKKTHKTNTTFSFALWKDIILAFLNNDDKEKDVYQFGLYFMSYLIYPDDPLEETFSIDELLLISSQLKLLETHKSKIYLGEKQKSIEANNRDLLIKLDSICSNKPYLNNLETESNI